MSDGRGPDSMVHSRRQREGVPSVSPGDLRDYDGSVPVARVWRRLEQSLDAPPARRRLTLHLGWATAVAAMAFIVGVSVGRKATVPAEAPVVQAPLSAEPPRVAGHVFEPPAPAPIVSDNELRSPITHSPPKPAHKRSLSEPSSSAQPEPDEAEQAPVEPTPETASEPAIEPPKWQRLANGGEYEAALFELGQVGGFESVLARATSEQLMLLVDIARATGQRQRAIAALRRVVAEHPDDPVAPLAAWSLGSILEKSGDKQGALRAFAAYRQLSPQGDFAEDALVRQLRGAVERGERELARQLAAQYDRDYPEGGRHDEIARWMAGLGGSADAVDSDAVDSDAVDSDAVDSDAGAAPPADGEDSEAQHPPNSGSEIAED